MSEDYGKITGIRFNIYTKNGLDLQKVAVNFDGCPLKDEDGNVIGKIIKAEWDGEKIKVEGQLD